jgi:hypothetical protein
MLTVNEVTSLTTSSPSSLTMQETGDQYGTSQLILQDRTGSNGALFTQTPNGENEGVNLVDFGFKPGAGVQSNIRLEARSAQEINTGNSNGEFQYIDNSTGAYKFTFAIGNTYAYIGESVGIFSSLSPGMANPAGQLANTSDNNFGSDGNGIGPKSFTWAATSDNGYAASITNEYVGNNGNGPYNNGLSVRVWDPNPQITALDVSQGGTSPGTTPKSLFTVKANGAIILSYDHSNNTAPAPDATVYTLDASTGTTITMPSGTNGQLLYIYNNSGHTASDSGATFTMPIGVMWAFVYANSTWQHAQ